MESLPSPAGSEVSIGLNSWSYIEDDDEELETSGPNPSPTLSQIPNSVEILQIVYEKITTKRNLPKPRFEILNFRRPYFGTLREYKNMTLSKSWNTIVQMIHDLDSFVYTLHDYTTLTLEYDSSDSASASDMLLLYKAFYNVMYPDAFPDDTIYTYQESLPPYILQHCNMYLFQRWYGMETFTWANFTSFIDLQMYKERCHDNSTWKEKIFVEKQEEYLNMRKYARMNFYITRERRYIQIVCKYCSVPSLIMILIPKHCTRCERYSGHPNEFFQRARCHFCKWNFELMNPLPILNCGCPTL